MWGWRNKSQAVNILKEALNLFHGYPELRITELIYYTAVELDQTAGQESMIPLKNPDHAKHSI